MVKIKHKSNLLELSTVGNGDLLAGFAIPAPRALYSCHNIPVSFTWLNTTCLTFNHSVLAVQMKNWEPFVLGSAFAMDKISGPVCYGDENLIKFLCINELATCAIMACEVTTLAHKSCNNSWKAGILKTKSFLSSAHSMKVFCCLWNFVCKQFQ